MSRIITSYTIRDIEGRLKPLLTHDRPHIVGIMREFFSVSIYIDILNGYTLERKSNTKKKIISNRMYEDMIGTSYIHSRVNFIDLYNRLFENPPHGTDNFHKTIENIYNYVRSEHCFNILQSELDSIHSKLCICVCNVIIELFTLYSICPENVISIKLFQTHLVIEHKD